MIFSSIEFVIFFLIFIISIKLFSKSQRNVIILFSLFFYSFWNLYFVILILYFCLITFLSIKYKFRIKYSLILIILPLFYFKYSFFFSNLFNIQIFHSYVYNGEIPLAISFITFTAIAAVIDVKKKIFNRELISFYNISEFILYFPQLIAGPILRLKELFPLLQNKLQLNKNNMKLGLILFLIGFIKKIFIADNIALIIDPIFLDPKFFSAEVLFRAFILFPFQIYFDFSGYIDMAMGAAVFMGIYFPLNFNKPYLTCTLTDFWRSWHMTLSRWFKDYVYIPLGGSKKNKITTYRNLLITMSLAGLWHGASLNFVIWGFLNGMILILEKIINYSNNFKFPKILLNCFIIFNLWLIFRITDFDLYFIFIKKLYTQSFETLSLINVVIFLFSIVLIYSQKFDNFFIFKKLSNKISLYSLVIFFIFIVSTGLALNLGQSEKFIYFQF